MRVFDVRASSSPTLMPNYIAPSIAELTRGEKSRTQSLTHLTSNVAGRHRGPKRMRRAGYIASSLQRTSYLCELLRCQASCIFHRVWYRALSRRMRVFDVRTSSLCQISFLSRPPHCWASPQRKIRYSITHPAAGNRSFRFGIMDRNCKHSLCGSCRQLQYRTFRYPTNVHNIIEVSRARRLISHPP